MFECFPVCNGCLVFRFSFCVVCGASFLVPNLRLLLTVLGVKSVTKLTVHVQPFSLEIKTHLYAVSHLLSYLVRLSLVISNVDEAHCMMLDILLCFDSRLCFDGPRSCFDSPRSSFDCPRLHFNGPRLHFNGLRSCFEGPHSCFNSPHLCFNSPYSFDNPRSQFDRRHSQFEGRYSRFHDPRLAFQFAC